MKLNNAELVAALEDEVEERYGFSYTEYDYPWETVIFKVAEQGEFTLENFLRYLGLIEAIELDDYFFDFELAISVLHLPAIQKLQKRDKYLKLEQKYNNLVNLLQRNSPELQAYKISIKSLNYEKETGNFKIIFRRISDGCWVGFAPIISEPYEFILQTSDDFLIKHTQPIDKKTAEFISELKSATDGLILPSELGRLIEPRTESIVEIAEARNLLLEKLLDSAGFIQTVDVKIGGDLGELLRENLTNLRQYIIWGFFIYIMGKTEDGDWIGISTKAVWT